MADELMLKELHSIQQVQREILKEFIRVCEENHLCYYMAEGSMLGAIRHGGMIPWDDDIDVIMPRADFDRFVSIANTCLRPPYHCRHYADEPGFIDYIVQIVDREAVAYTSYRQENEKINLWIDVFVLDGMPKGTLAHKARKFHLLARKLMLMWSDMDHFVMKRSNRPGYERALIWFGRTFHLSRFIDSGRMLRKMDRCMRACPLEAEGLSVNFMSEYKWRTEFPTAWYGKGRMVDFDGQQVRIPERAENMLRSIYGEYLRLPPEEQRYKHGLHLSPIEEKKT